MLALITATKNSMRSIRDALGGAASFRHKVKHYQIDPGRAHERECTALPATSGSQPCAARAHRCRGTTSPALRRRHDPPKAAAGGEIINYKRVERLYGLEKVHTRRRRRKKIPVSYRQRVIAGQSRKPTPAMRHSVRRAWCSARHPIPDKPVLLTFHKAYAVIYAEIAEHALAILYEWLHGVVFVITGQPGGSTVWEGLRLMAMEQIQNS